MALLFASACEEVERDAASTRLDVSEAPTVSHELDAREVVERLRHTFVRDGGAVLAEHSAFAVEVGEGGALALHPADADAIAFQTTTIERDEGDLVADPGALEVAGTRVSVARGVAVESLDVRDEGVEQSWSFARVPEGSGELVVRVAVDGYAHDDDSEDAHRFVDPATGLAIIYGVATWIDAAGQRSRVPVAWDEGELVLTVPESLVDGSKYPAVLDPVIGPEIVANDGLQPAAANQSWAGVASDGAGRQLVVWEDRRAGNDDVRGAFIDSEYGLVTPAGFSIASGAGNQRTPVVGYDGNDWVVAWADESVGAGNILATRVTEEGAVLDPGGRAVATTVAWEATPSIACEPGQCLIAWFDGTVAPSDIRGRLFVSAGGFAGPSFVVAGAVNGQFSPSIAYAGGTYVVVWHDERIVTDQIFATRVTPAGVVVDAAGILLSTGDFNHEPTVAIGSGQVFAAWIQTVGASRSIRARRLSLATGAVLDAAPLDLGSAGASAAQPGVAFDGTNAVVAWGNGVDLYARRVSTAGALVDPAPVDIGTPQTQPYPEVVAAFDGTDVFVAWADQRHPATTRDIYATRVSTTLTRYATTDMLVSTEPTAEQAYPALAWDGKAYLLVWQDRRGGTWDIMGARVERTGIVTNDEPFVISAATNDQVEPAIAFNGSSYLVTWADSRAGAANYNIYAARVDPYGNVSDPGGIAVSTAVNHQRRPSAAWNGTNYLVAWTDQRSGGSDIYAARVQGNTTLDAAGIAISNAAAFDGKVDVAHGSTWSYVVWERQLSPPGVLQLRGTAVSSAGAVHTLNGVSLAISSNVQEEPAVASHGTNEFMIVWQEVGRIRGRAHAFDGSTLSGSFDIGSGANPEGDPDIAWDGDRYHVVWRENGGSAGIHGASIAFGGPVLEAEFSISDLAVTEDQPAIASADRAMLLAAYRSVTGAIRVRGRTIGNGCCNAAGTTPGCLDVSVESCVCAVDPFCCTTDWDGICVGEVDTLGCGSCDCCSPTGAAGCGGGSVEECVCAWDPYCCSTAWDALCVEEVVTRGCGAC